MLPAPLSLPASGFPAPSSLPAFPKSDVQTSWQRGTIHRSHRSLGPSRRQRRTQPQQRWSRRSESAIHGAQPAPFPRPRRPGFLPTSWQRGGAIRTIAEASFPSTVLTAQSVGRRQVSISRSFFPFLPPCSPILIFVRARRHARRLAGPERQSVTSTGAGCVSGGGPAGHHGRPCRRHCNRPRQREREKERERERESGGGVRPWRRPAPGRSTVAGPPRCVAGGGPGRRLDCSPVSDETGEQHCRSDRGRGGERKGGGFAALAFGSGRRRMGADCRGEGDVREEKERVRARENEVGAGQRGGEEGSGALQH